MELTALGYRIAKAIGDESINGFAKRAGIGESVVRSYINGTTPRLDKIALIAQAAGVSIDWLATGKEPTASSPTAKIQRHLNQILDSRSLTLEETEKIHNLSQALNALQSTTYKD